MKPRRRLQIGLWLAFFALYAATTAREVLPADGGEFQLAAAGWGILHPPGYPLYTMLSGVWVRLLPLGALPFRLNLLSAALAATTLVLLMEATRVWAHHVGIGERPALAGGLGAALLLGLSPTFWAQATTANIRMPTLLFGAWGFLALGQVARDKDARALTNLALALGLGVGHHPSLAFIAVGWAGYLLLSDPRLFIQPGRWWKAALVAALAWGLPQLYIPLRGSMADVPLAVDGLATWGGFWQHVLARGFTGDMLAFANAQDLALRLPLLPTLYGFQFWPLFLAATALSWAWLLRKDWRLAASLLLAWALHTFITLTYRAPQTVEYLMPAYLPLALTFGIGLAAVKGLGQTSYVKRHTSSRLAFDVLRLIFYALLLLRAPLYLSDFLTLAADTSIRDRTVPLLDAAPPGALILADWHWATPLWVLQTVEGRSADVEVAYVYPEPPLDYEAVWRARAEAAGERPVFTTHAYSWPGWTAAPVGGGYRLYRQPATTLDPTLGFIPLDTTLGPVRVVGYKLAGTLTPGSVVEVQLAWQAVGAQDPAPSFAGRLWGPEGDFLAADDQFLGSDTAPGEVRFAQLELLLPLDRCPASAQPALSVYTVQDGTFQTLGELALPALPLTCTHPRLPSGRFHPGIALGGPFLRGYDYNVGESEATLYLHWCGPGKAAIVTVEEQSALVGPLGLGDCQSVSLKVAADARPALRLARLDGRTAPLWSAPLAAPRPTERYVPFGNRMVLTGVAQTERGEQLAIDLRWRVICPLVEDYSVSVRLLGTGGEQLAAHDFQPALSDIPTLKWVIHGASIFDPHPFALPEAAPAAVNVAVYERFRLTPLPSVYGDVAHISLQPGPMP